jgi:uncharacterized protein YeeX (DUF496 family)
MKTNAKLIKIIESIIFENASDHVKKLFDSWAKNKSGNYDKAISLMDDFFEYASMLPKNDFAQYSSADEMESAILNAKKVKTEKSEKKSASSDIDKIYEDDNVLVIKAKTYKASCKYGAGSKWCTASKKTDEDWLRHNRTGVEFIWINKKLLSDDNNHKLSLFFKYSNKRVDWCDRINRCDSTAPYEKNDLGVENWKQIFELCQNYFDKSLEDYLKKRAEWDKNLLEKEAEFLNKINDEDFLTNIMNDVFNSITTDGSGTYKLNIDFLAYTFARLLYYANMLQHRPYIISDYIRNNTASMIEFIKIFKHMFFYNVDLFKIYYEDVVSYLFSSRYRFKDEFISDEEIFEEIKGELAFIPESFIEIYEREILNYFTRYFEDLTSSKDFSEFVPFVGY